MISSAEVSILDLANLGIAAVVLGWFMFRTDKNLQQLTEAVKSNSTILNKLIDHLSRK